MRYRKKPVEVEARRITRENIADVAAWCDGAWCDGWLADRKPRILIETLEGEMAAHIGDWVLRGVEGEFYPVKHRIFELTYEVAE